MRTLHIILPMAGRGSRFAKAGFKTPKPLIEVDGMPMFLKALSSLEGIKASKRYTIIIRNEHDQEYGLSKLLKDKLPLVNIITSDQEPIGPVADLMRARRLLKHDEGIISLDCDLWFQSKSYNKMVEEALTNKADHHGGLLTFEADNPRYSYAKIGKDNIVTETAEKVVISNRAITGAYFFSTAKEFIDVAERLLQQPLTEKMPEYYISFLYNIIINEGKKIKAAFVDKFASFGTPEELAAYQESRSA